MSLHWGANWEVGVGRQRDVTIDESILRDGAALVRETGYDGFSVERLSARVGVPKSTVYRRWKTREELLGEILAVMLEPRAVSLAPPEGSRRDALVAAVQEEIAFAGLPEGRAAAAAVLQALGTESHDKSTLVAQMRHRRERLARFVAAASARGEDPFLAAAARERATDLLFSAAWGGVLSDSRALSTHTAELVANVLSACGLGAA